MVQKNCFATEKGIISKQDMTNANHYEDFKIGQDIVVIKQQDFPVRYHLHWHKYAEVISRPASPETDAGLIEALELPVITINQRRYELKPGDTIIVWPGELHEISGNHQKSLMALQFPITLFTEIPDFAVYVNLFRTYHLISVDNMPGLAQNMTSFLMHMEDIKSSDSLFPTVEMLITLYEMFMLLGGHIREQAGPETDRTLIKIDQACRYIQENCDQDVALNTVAEHIGFSACYFSRIFKQTTQYSFVDYLNIQRVKRAQTCLVDPLLTMTEISYRAGFKSISTFNRVFRQFRGCSPSEYRKYYSEGI